MIRRLLVYNGQGFDPYRNLAVEEQLLSTVEEGCCILYLWQNRNTVVIGRNQNAWKECRVQKLQADGGHLARRLSGGGAVFHDLGNLNFTFLLPSADYDSSGQFAVILRACRSLGIPAVLSGRNDLLAQGRKFSGSAFYHHNGRSYHHGTLLVSCDEARMGLYLRPSAEKLKAKGVDSVQSRVVNLASLCPGLTVETLRQALITAFREVFDHLPVEYMGESALDPKAVAVLCERNRSWEWNFGRELPFDLSCERRFDWGELHLELRVTSGVIEQVRVFTDAMDWALPQQIENALRGCRLVPDEMSRRLLDSTIEHSDDLCTLLQNQIL